MERLLAAVLGMVGLSVAILLSAGAIGEQFNLRHLSNPLFRKVRQSYTDEAYEDRVKWNLILTLPMCLAILFFTVVFRN